NFPATVAKNAPLSFSIRGDIPHQFDSRIAVSLCISSLNSVHYRGELEILIQGFMAFLMHGADGPSYLFITIGGQVFHDEVDKPSIALENSQYLKRTIRNTH